MNISLPSINYLALAPVLTMVGGALILLFATALSAGRLGRRLTTSAALLTGVAALVETFFQWSYVVHHGATTTAAYAIAFDGFSVVATAAIAIGFILTTLVAHDWSAREGFVGAEFHILALAATSGAMVMAQANDLIVIFLGLEILSIGLYVLVAFDRHRASSAEASLKYFLLGGFASAIFIYGAALTYGATGSTTLSVIATFLTGTFLIKNGVLVAGAGLLLVGFAFKVAAVPFHLWAPDVYEGAPSPVTGLMAAIVKVGAFTAVLRVLASALGTSAYAWRPIVWVLVVLTTFAGAGLALVQQNIKRLLAYSSITNAGFILLGLWSTSPRGAAATLYYVLTYAPLIISIFAVVTLVGGPGDTRHGLENYRGLARRQPWLGGCLTVLLLAQSGAPFTTGFFAKYSVVAAAIGAGGAILAALVMLAAAIAAYVYLRLVLALYAEDTDDTAVLVPVPTGTGLVITLGAASSILFGVWVGPLVNLAHHATLLFLP